MFDRIRNNDLVSAQQIEELVSKFHKKEQQKKNYTWLIIITSVLVLGVGAALVYKFFFAPVDDYYDDDYDDFDDMDYDEDYDDEIDEMVDEMVDDVVENEEEI